MDKMVASAVLASNRSPIFVGVKMAVVGVATDAPVVLRIILVEDENPFSDDNVVDFVRSTVVGIEHRDFGVWMLVLQTLLDGLWHDALVVECLLWIILQ